MKKATQIVLLIAGILAIVGAVAWLVAGIYYFVMGGICAMIAAGESGGDLPESIQNWIINYIQQHPEFKSMEEVAGSLIGTGVVFVVFAIFCIPAAVLSFLARKKDVTGLYIACIVLGALSATGLPLIGGVLGLIHKGVDKE